MNQLKICLLLCLLTVFKIDSIAHTLPSLAGQDSLVIQKEQSDKQIIIRPGEKIKVWMGDKRTKIGKFQALDQGKVMLIIGSKEHAIPVHEIEKMRIYGNRLAQVIGGGMVVLGAGGMVFGGISLVAGTLALLADDIGAIILVAVPFLGGGGFGLFKLGKRITGRRIDLSEWTIDVHRV